MAKDWFIRSGTPARDGNKVIALVDGQEAWLDVLPSLNAARRTIHIALWMMHLDHELERPASLEFKDPADRESRTLHATLLNARERGVRIRILLWITPNIPSTELELLKLLVGPTLDPFSLLHKYFVLPATVVSLLDTRILTYAVTGTFEVLLEPHPTHLIGSWHQKTFIIDDTLAYVGGMNARQNDWDATHAVYDYRRTPHTTTASKRTSMQSRKELPDYAPRHDFMTRIEGPLVMDVANNFAARWNNAINDDRFFTRRATPVASATSPPASAGKLTGQIVRTMPKCRPAPSGEKGCLELYQKAIANAESYIYIEDQYFRSQQLAQSLAAACARNPKLLLIVVTPPDMLAEMDWADIGLANPSTYWTTDTFETIVRVIPEFCLFHLQVAAPDASGAQRYVPVNTHAKLMIVDDEWYTIGSCNINERGFLFEGEMNIGVESPADASQLRLRLWAEHLGVPCPNKIQDAAKLWYDHARQNFAAQKAGRSPISRVFPFVQKGPLLPIVPKTWF